MSKEKITLIPLEEEHIDIVRGWRNDKAIRKYFFNWNYINQNQQQDWFKGYCLDDKQIIFAIIHNVDDCFIGTIGLSNIDHFNQRAELGTLIGNKEYWGKGYATIATLKILDYAFNKLNLKRVYSHIIDSNMGSIRKNEKVGFKREGRLRDHAFNNGRFHDVVQMGILKEEYYEVNSDKNIGGYDGFK